MARYAFTDVHGQYNLWKQVSEYVKPNDKLYFLGDACDRGPDGIKIINELLADKRVHYIKGNHEQFLVDTIAYMLNMNEDDNINNDYCVSLHLQNGGMDTILALQDMSNIDLFNLMLKLDHLPTSITFKNKQNKTIFLSHAGKDPTDDIMINSCAYGEPLLWNREHFHYPWPKDEKYKDLILVHGHTPVSALPQLATMANDMELPSDPYSVFYYAGGHKIDMDLGSFATHKLALLDLDTLQVVKYFYDGIDSE